jgi:hypothetical protein
MEGPARSQHRSGRVAPPDAQTGGYFTLNQWRPLGRVTPGRLVLGRDTHGPEALTVERPVETRQGAVRARPGPPPLRTNRRRRA